MIQGFIFSKHLSLCVSRKRYVHSNTPVYVRGVKKKVMASMPEIEPLDVIFMGKSVGAKEKSMNCRHCSRFVIVGNKLPASVMNTKRKGCRCS